MELKKLEAEIEMLKNKIKEQGMITNARDEERLDNLNYPDRVRRFSMHLLKMEIPYLKNVPLKHRSPEQ